GLAREERANIEDRMLDAELVARLTRVLEFLLVALAIVDRDGFDPGNRQLTCDLIDSRMKFAHRHVLRTIVEGGLVEVGGGVQATRKKDESFPVHRHFSFCAG